VASTENGGRWDNELWKALEKERDMHQKIAGPYAFREPDPDRPRLKKLAKEVLDGKATTTTEVATTTEVEKETGVR